MKDSLGDRMKREYEGVTRAFLPENSNVIIRLDGKAFHTYTRGLERPYDIDLIQAMDDAAINVVSSVQGAKLGYVQSDEISILVTDYDTAKTQMYFNGNIQKIASVTASVTTLAFNNIRNFQGFTKPAYFDSRVFSIPQEMPQEVLNYFLWRQRDCERNAKMSLAQAHMSHKEIHNKNTMELVGILKQEHGVDWHEQREDFKHGRFIVKEQYEKLGSIRSRWVSIPATPILENKSFIYNLLPVQPVN